MRRTILLLAIFGGVTAALLGLGMGGLISLSLLLEVGEPANPLQINAFGFGVMAAGTGLGLALAWSGWRGLAAAAARPLRLPGWGWWLLAFGVTVGAGYVSFELGLMAVVVVLYVLANALAALGVLALAAGGSRRAAVSTRSAVGSLAWGGLGGAGLAFIAEILAVLVAVVLASIWLTAVQPGLLEQLRFWAEGLQRDRPGELRELLPLLRSPWIVIALLAFTSVLVPVLEEGFKALAVPLAALTGRRPRWVDGFLLGAAAGAGFALVEGVLNGALGLVSPSAWAGVALSRGAAAAVHCAASALAGLGWALIIERRWLYGLGLGLAAVSLHGAWNAAAIGLAARAIAGAGNAITLLFVGYMGILWVFAVLLLAFAPRWLAQHDALESL